MKEKLIAWLKGMAFDKAKELFETKKTEQQIDAALDAFFVRQSKINELCSLVEEIDFEGLCSFIQSDAFLVDVQTRLLSGKSKERGQARKSIEERAYAYAGAQTEESRKRTSRFVTLAIDIIREFYVQQFGKGNLLNIVLIQDHVSEIADEKTRELSDKFDKAVKQLAVYSPEYMRSLALEGKIEEASQKLNDLIHAASTKHPLYPDYGYAISCDYGSAQLISHPISEVAKIKYPPHFKLSGSVKVGDKSISRITPDVFEYAYRHQLKITLSVEEAVKFLGTQVDIVQIEAKPYIGNEITLPPKPFPPAFPCAILMDNKVVYDYLELRTEEILDDGTYVISNVEQSSPAIGVRLETKMDGSLPKILFSLEGANHRNILRFDKLLQKANEGAEFGIKVLSLDQMLLSGILDKNERRTEFGSLEEEIEFLEQLVSIEEYLGHELQINDGITMNDRFDVELFATLLRGESREYKGRDFDINVPFTENLRRMIVENQEKAFFFTYVGTATIGVMGTLIEIPFMRYHVGVKFKYPQKLLKLASALDIGDPIKVDFLATEESKFVDMMASDELIQSLKEEGVISST